MYTHFLDCSHYHSRVAMDVTIKQHDPLAPIPPAMVMVVVYGSFIWYVYMVVVVVHGSFIWLRYTIVFAFVIFIRICIFLAC